MKTIYSFLSVLFVVTLLGCTKEDRAGVETVLFHYDETQCADPWVLESDGGHTGVSDLLKSYLEERGVTVFGVDISVDESVDIVCEACICPSGRIISVEVNEADAATVEALDFYR